MAPADRGAADVPPRQGEHAEPAVWVNGARMREGEAHISARDRGFTLADGVFETMRVRRGHVFRLDRHLSRLSEALLVLRIPAAAELRQWVQDAVAEWADVDAAVRVTVTRGIGAAGLVPPKNPRPTVVVAVAPMPVFAKSVYETGLSACVVSGRRNERSMTAGLKTVDYIDAVVGLFEAQRAGADEALFLDTEDHVSEATASNCFMWTGASLVTPPIGCGVLPGITRAAILEIAYGLGIEVGDRAFGLAELVAAREAFLTSSLRGVAPLVRLDGTPIGSGAPGEVTRRLMDAYAALVERECAG